MTPQTATRTIDFKAAARDLLPAGASYNACLSCGLCSAGCRASGLEGMDPRRFMRMAMLDMNEELSTTAWVWTCTQCQRCKYVCPMSIDVSVLVGLPRGAWPKEKKPKGIVRSCEAQLHFPGDQRDGAARAGFRRGHRGSGGIGTQAG